MGKTSEIKFFVELDENKVPSSIRWFATDSEMEKPQNCDALMISFWDREKNDTLGIDLWTNDLLINEMYIHVFQTLMKMADTLEKSTKNSEAAEMMRKFSLELGEKLKILESDKD